MLFLASLKVTLKNDRPARNGPWAAGLAASEEKSGAAETYESNIYQPKYDVGSKKGTKTDKPTSMIYYYVLPIICTKISCMFERMIFKH